ncbi:MAG: hypothetical protein IPN03_09805 [Holophagales bacterium]|nr:hypothetical protein [Holophagales bacterium]
MKAHPEGTNAPAAPPKAPPVLDARKARRILAALEEGDLDGPLIVGEAEIARIGGRRNFSLPQAPPADCLWEVMRPDDLDVARIRAWSERPEMLVGRILYWDSRRGTELSLGEIRRGFDDFFSGIHFSPEAFSVYMLRWLENQWQLSMEIGVDLEAERLAGTPLGTIAKYSWMLEGLPPDPAWSRLPEV